MTISGKSTVLVTALLLGGMGGIVANAAAQDEEAVTLEPISIVAEAEDETMIPLRLEEGHSEDQRVMGVNRYAFTIDEPSRVQVRTHLWTATSPNNVVLRGNLYDEHDNLIAEGRRIGRKFTFDQMLEPGDYMLEVEGQFLSGTQTGSPRYYLTTPAE